MKTAGIGFAVLAAGLCLPPAVLAGTLFGTTPYRSFAESPFTDAFDWFRLQDFESGATSIPGVTVSVGPIVLAPGLLTDSVDADDGAIDGSGRGGRSLYSNGVQRITFSFDKTFLGQWPTHVGVVVTDVGTSIPTFGFGRFVATATIPSEILVGSFTSTFAVGSSFIGTWETSSSVFPPILALGAPDVPSWLVRDPVTGAIIDSRTGLPVSFADFGVTVGDGQVDGATDEDRFFGLIEPRGITSFTIESLDSTDWEIDHLHFGFSAAVAATVPVPASALLLATGVVALGARRRTGGR